MSLSLGLSSGTFGDDFFLRSSSSSISRGNVGDNNGSRLKGDLGRLALGGASAFLDDFIVFPASAVSSERLFSNLLVSLRSLLPSMSKCNGDNKGGTDAFDASPFFGVPWLLSAACDLAPLIEFPRERGGGEPMRLELVAFLMVVRPFGNEDEEATGLLSFQSRAAGRSWGLRRKGSSRWVFDLSSPARLSSSVGFGRFGGRAASSESAGRFLLPGEGGRGGYRERGGFGGSLFLVSNIFSNAVAGLV